MIFLLWATLGLAQPHGAAPSCEGEVAAEMNEAVELLHEGVSGESFAWLAACLERLELWHLAMRHHQQLLLEGRDKPTYVFALSGAFSAAISLGDVESTAWALRDGEEALWFLSPSRDAMLWLYGQRLAERGRLGMASSVLGDVEAGSPWYGPAQRGLGEALARRGLPTEALAAYQIAADHSGEAGAEAAIRGAALLAEGERVEEAVALLEASPALSEGARRVALARIALEPPEQDAVQAVQAVKRAARTEWRPEAGLFEARLRTSRCQARRGARALKRWRAELEPERLRLQGLTPGTRLNGLNAWEQYAGPEPVDIGLDPRVLARIERDERLTQLRAHLGSIGEERAALSGMDGLSAEARHYLEYTLRQGEQRVRASVGVRFLQVAQALEAELQALEAEARALEAQPGCR